MFKNWKDFQFLSKYNEKKEEVFTFTKLENTTSVHLRMQTTVQINSLEIEWQMPRHLGTPTTLSQY